MLTNSLDRKFDMRNKQMSVFKVWEPASFTAIFVRSHWNQYCVKVMFQLHGIYTAYKYINRKLVIVIILLVTIIIISMQESCRIMISIMLMRGHGSSVSVQLDTIDIKMQCCNTYNNVKVAILFSILYGTLISNLIKIFRLTP